MRTIQILEENDIIYFLSNTEGFVQGNIKQVIFEKGKLKYLVTCNKYGKEYMGTEKLPSEVFIKYTDMLTYYTNKFDEDWNQPKQKE